MKPSSAKAKGRLLQQKFRNMLVDILGLDEEPRGYQYLEVLRPGIKKL